MIKSAKKMIMQGIILAILLTLLTSITIAAEDASSNQPSTSPNPAPEPSNPKPAFSDKLSADSTLTQPPSQYADTASVSEKQVNDIFMESIKKIAVITAQSDEETINTAMDDYTQVVDDLKMRMEINQELIKNKKPEAKISEEVKKALEAKYQMFVDIKRWQEVPGVPKDLRAGVSGSTGFLGKGGILLLIILLVLGGGGFLIFKKKERKDKFIGQILTGIDRIDQKLKEWINNSYKGMSGINIIIKAKNTKIEENDREIATIYKDLTGTLVVISKHTGLKESYENDKPEQFEKNLNKFLEEDKTKELVTALGRNAEYRLNLLLSLHKHKKLEGTKIEDRTKKIKKYNELFKIRIERTTELYEKIKKELATILTQKNTEESKKGLKMLYDLTEKIPPKDKVAENTGKILIDRINSIKEEEKKADAITHALIIYYKEVGEHLKNLKADITPEEKIESLISGAISHDIKDSKTLKEVAEELIRMNRQVKLSLNTEAEHAKKLEISQEKLKNALGMLEKVEKEMKERGKDLTKISEELKKERGIETTRTGEAARIKAEIGTDPHKIKEFIYHKLENLTLTELENQHRTAGTIREAVSFLKEGINAQTNLADFAKGMHREILARLERKAPLTYKKGDENMSQFIAEAIERGYQ